MSIRLASPVHSRELPASCLGHVLTTLWTTQIGFYLEPNPDGVTIYVHEMEAHVLDAAVDHTALALN